MNKDKRITIGFTALFDYRSNNGQEFFSGINTAAKDFGVNLINFVNVIRYSFAEDIENYSLFKNMAKYLNLNNIDGLISRASSFQYMMTMKEIEEFHESLYPLPVVSIGIPFNNIPTIRVDNYASINEIILHLVNVHGFKKIAFIGCSGHIAYQDRFKAYKKILNENNIGYNPDLLYIINDVDSRQQVKNCLNVLFDKRKLKIKKDIEAFITVSDLIAQNLIEELANYNIKVPLDTAVMGYNNQLNSIKSFPTITTIDLNFFDAGYKAVAMLLSIIKENKKIGKVVMPTKLIVRQSCGCCEDIIGRVVNKNCDNKNSGNDFFDKDNYEKIITDLAGIICKYDLSLNQQAAIEMVDSLKTDITAGSASNFMNIITAYFHKCKKNKEEKLFIWQNIISSVRNIILSFKWKDEKQIKTIENIFHQSRLMIDVTYSNLNIINEFDAYREGNIARMAVDFTFADDIDGILGILKKDLNKLGIPGFYLALLNEPKDNMSTTILINAYNVKDDVKFKKEVVIPNFHLIPKGILPEKRQHSMLFEFLSYKGMYLGFILFEMDSFNITLYDNLHLLLSASLYRAINVKNEENLRKEKKLLSHNIDMIDERKVSVYKSHQGNVQGNVVLNANKIIEYLIANLNHPTDLLKFSDDFNMSRVSLLRKTKELTGFTLQKLHEKLKIEKAKMLLDNKALTVSEISDQLGYQNQFYFSSVFKKHTGMSPKKWLEFK